MSQSPLQKLATNHTWVTTHTCQKIRIPREMQETLNLSKNTLNDLKFINDMIGFLRDRITQDMKEQKRIFSAKNKNTS